MDPDVTVKSISPIVQTVNTCCKQNEREAAYDIADAHMNVELKCLHVYSILDSMDLRGFFCVFMFHSLGTTSIENKLSFGFCTVPVVYVYV